MKAVNLMLYGASFLCFLLVLFVGDSLLAALGCIPFFLLVCAAFHELGHCAGCLLTGSTIREVRLPLCLWNGTGLQLSSRISPVSCCTFRKNKAPWLVYLMGPLFSLVLFCGCLWVCLRLPGASTVTACILTFGVFAVNTVPYKGNDMAMFLREILLRNENDS
jgi:hypothetical protein